MTTIDPLFLPEGTTFTAADITFYAAQDRRSIDDAIDTADLLISCPHSGAAIPGELRPFLVPEFSRRLQHRLHRLLDVADRPAVGRAGPVRGLRREPAPPPRPRPQSRPSGRPGRNTDRGPAPRA
ncbi:hypothetical protein [Aeromicrobium sp. UC242_57]|uniref:hypothetical protein n=1 Tax=Aeromicrobium sp. UC242_57 TaxID=3374624 RepID=UPI0037A44057